MSNLRLKRAHTRRVSELRSKGKKGLAWSHSELVMDLADWFYGDRIVFAEVGVGSRWLRGEGLPVPDVLTFNKSYVHPMPAIYEVKVNRHDFQSDVRANKWMKYTRFCSRFYFATPRGLVKKSEVPQEAGLFVRGPNGWVTVKAPRVFKSPDIGQYEMMSLLMAGAYTGEKVRSLRERVNLRENVELGSRCRAIGYEIGKAINRLKRGEAAGSPAAQSVLEKVADVLGVTVLELIELGPYEVSNRLLDARQFEREVELVKEAAMLLEGRWQRFGGREYAKRQDRMMRDLGRKMSKARKEMAAEEGSRGG